jgi:hypothetical protein
MTLRDAHFAGLGAHTAFSPARTALSFPASKQGDYVYFIARDVSSEKRVEETLRSFLLTTRHARARTTNVAASACPRCQENLPFYAACI